MFVSFSGVHSLLPIDSFCVPFCTSLFPNTSFCTLCCTFTFPHPLTHVCCTFPISHCLMLYAVLYFSFFHHLILYTMLDILYSTLALDHSIFPFSLFCLFCTSFLTSLFPRHLILYTVLCISYSTSFDSLHCAVHPLFHIASFCTLCCTFPL